MTIAFFIHPLPFVSCTTAQGNRWTENPNVLLACLINLMHLVWNAAEIFLIIKLVVELMVPVQELLVLIELRCWELVLQDVLTLHLKLSIFLQSLGQVFLINLAHSSFIFSCTSVKYARAISHFTY